MVVTLLQTKSMKVAQGRVWTGTQALEHKLIDEIGGLNDAIDRAAQFIDAEDYNLVTIPQSKSVLKN